MLKAGFSRVDVTPPLGSFMSGYFENRFAKGILDPIELNAIALSDGESDVLWIVGDFLGMDKVYCDIIREKIAARVSLPVGNIILSSLHQHTSVYIGMRDMYMRNDLGYMDFLYRKYGDVAQMALDDRKDAVLRVSIAKTSEDIAFNRNHLMKDGSIMGHPFGRTDEIVRRLDEGDNTVRLLRFAREGAKDIALVNFCTHPDVIGGEYFSADWPGFTRRNVERDLEDVSCVLLNGAQGDSNHCDYINGVKRGYNQSVHMGRVIADTVKSIWDQGVPVEDACVNVREQVLLLPTRTDGVEDYEACRKLLDDVKNNRCEKRPSGSELGRASRIVKMRTAPMFTELPVTAVQLGSVFIVGYGGEPFTRYTTALRENYPENLIIGACCTNGYQGYLPTKEIFAYDRCYEANSSPFPNDLEEQCFQAATSMIDEMK